MLVVLGAVQRMKNTKADLSLIFFWQKEIPFLFLLLSNLKSLEFMNHDIIMARILRQACNL